MKYIRLRVYLPTKGDILVNPQEVRATLIARTISVIADEGLDKTTTKAIVTGTGINEAYIYRYFDGKEDLLSKAFDFLDNELVEKTLEYLPAMYEDGLSTEQCCRNYFFPMWDFLLASREKCLAYMRYLYSTYFTKLSAASHRQRFAVVEEKFSKAFIDEADVWMILNHIFNIMLSFAVMVHNGHMSEDDDYSEHVFRVTYASVKQYFKFERKSEE